jgi:hypothetical protein
MERDRLKTMQTASVYRSIAANMGARPSVVEKVTGKPGETSACIVAYRI